MESPVTRMRGRAAARTTTDRASGGPTSERSEIVQRPARASRGRRRRTLEPAWRRTGVQGVDVDRELAQTLAEIPPRPHVSLTRTFVAWPGRTRAGVTISRSRCEQLGVVIVAAVGGAVAGAPALRA